MNILTKPVYTILGELLDIKSAQRESAIEVFHDNLIMVASLLQEADKVHMAVWRHSFMISLQCNFKINVQS